MKTFFKILLGLITLGLLGLALGAYLFYGQTTTNIHNYASLGDIPTPMGYHRISGSRPAYSDYLRSLPLKERGSAVELYTGGPSHLQSLAYAVVDLPLLSNPERPLDRTKGSHRRTVEVENEDGTKKRVPDWDGDYVSVFIPLKGDTITLEDGWTM